MTDDAVLRRIWATHTALGHKIAEQILHNLDLFEGHPLPAIARTIAQKFLCAIYQYLSGVEVTRDLDQEIARMLEREVCAATLLAVCLLEAQLEPSSATLH